MGDAKWKAEFLWLRGAIRRIADAVGAEGGVDRTVVDEILERVSANTLLSENRQWREFAWLACAHGSRGKYGDDGEMQCHGADFRRGKIEDLSEHLRLARLE